MQQKSNFLIKNAIFTENFIKTRLIYNTLLHIRNYSINSALQISRTQQKSILLKHKRNCLYILMQKRNSISSLSKLSFQGIFT